jgi:hypothetical protein
MQMTASRQRVLRIMLAAGGLLASATALAFGIGAVLDRPATLMSPGDYRAAKATIREHSRFALDKCLMLEGAVFDVCRAQAQAEERTHRAALEARYLGTVDAAESARQAQAEAMYDVAVAQCDTREGKARLACLKDARADKAKQLSSSSLTS